MYSPFGKLSCYNQPFSLSVSLSLSLWCSKVVHVSIYWVWLCWTIYNILQLKLINLLAPILPGFAPVSSNIHWHACLLTLVQIAPMLTRHLVHNCSSCCAGFAVVSSSNLFLCHLDSSFSSWLFLGCPCVCGGVCGWWSGLELWSLLSIVHYLHHNVSKGKLNGQLRDKLVN